MGKTMLGAVLAENPWFSALQPPHFQTLLGLASYQEWGAETTIFKEGEPADYLYLILEGRIALELYVPGRGRATILTLGPDDIFGWSAVLPIVGMRTASARALQPARLVAFHSQKLREACEADHHLGYQVYRRLSNIIAGRLSATRLQLLDVYAHS